MTTQANLYVDQGTDYAIDLVLTTNNGVEYPVSNKSFYCNIKKLYSSTASANAEITAYISSNTSTIELYLAAETTRDLDPGKYTYDVIMITQGGTETKILEGLMNILPTNTRV
jgi:hypothetical protein